MNIKYKRRTPHKRDYNRDPFYQSKEWKAKRKEIVKRDEHLCQACKRLGRVTTGKYMTVDHIVPIKRGGNRLDSSNLQLLCKKCHDTKSATEKR